MTGHAAGWQRLRVRIRGAVQGVGFRPFVYRLASDLGLAGWVINSSSGVEVEVEGLPDLLARFLVRLERDQPPRAVIQGLEASYLDPLGFDGFEIRESVGGEKTALVLPDIATCPDCLHEVFDPANRRYRYPFTNCTNCGPRFSIIRALPYDRPMTTMAGFAMCAACRREYEDPRDRRFHAQPNACPACGPHLEMWDESGSCVATHDVALRAAAAHVRDGAVVALKGLGGFQLIVDARNERAVQRLRRAKAREEKPFAVMAPSMEAVRAVCAVSDLEARLLASPEAPIVLLRRREKIELAEGVAPGNPTLGVMLPYTPLHHVLLADLSTAIVATSGNRADEPICTDQRDALERLRGLADVFLVHDRPIARHVDDSVARVMMGRELITRRARGYAPMPVRLGRDVPPTLGVGAHLKNAVALSVGRNVFVSQHIGDLETPEAYRAFEQAIVALEDLYEAPPVTVVCDAHPDYLSTRYAQRRGLPVRHVQHHVAHVLACMAENDLEPPALGVGWDGTGYGLDGTVWGGEFFHVTTSGAERVATFRTFGLPGGDQAVREPRRTALGLLHEVMGEQVWQCADLAPVAAFETAERAIIRTMLERRVNTPRTSSVGRLFDAVAAIVGLRQHVRYEGQAAMELEFALDEVATDEHYPFDLRDGGSECWAVDWAPLVDALVADVRAGRPVPLVSARFHNALVDALVAVASRTGVERVVLSGGCFQNRYLTEQSVRRLREAGFRPYWHQRVPPNDGGIALGQVAAVALGFARAAER
ncbi:MAG TPA: carbamoyltransferase HypF [Vicinamibacterales bacterium]